MADASLGVPNLANIQMPSLPNPAAGIQAPNLFTQFAQAVGQFPQQQQAAQDQQMERKVKAQQFGEQQLKFISQMLSGNPNAARDPQMIKNVQNIYKQMGVPAPLKGDGSIDIDQITPKGDFNQLVALNPKLYDDAMKYSPEERRARFKGMMNVPEEFFSAKATLPEVEKVQAHNNLARQIDTVSKGGSVDDFFAWLHAEEPTMQLAGIDTKAIAQDSRVKIGIGAAARAKILAEENLGIYHADEIANKRRALDIALKNADSLDGLRKVQEQFIGIKSANYTTDLQNKWDYHAGMLQAAQGRTQAALQNAQTAVAKVQATRDIASMNNARAVQKNLNDEANAAQKTYEGMVYVAKMGNQSGQALPEGFDAQIKAAKDRAEGLHNASKQIDGVLGLSVNIPGGPQNVKLQPLAGGKLKSGPEMGISHGDALGLKSALLQAHGDVNHVLETLRKNPKNKPEDLKKAEAYLRQYQMGGDQPTPSSGPPGGALLNPTGGGSAISPTSYQPASQRVVTEMASLHPNMASALHTIIGEGYKLEVHNVVGDPGDHVRGSAHYDHRAVDIGLINGVAPGENAVTWDLIKKAIDRGGLEAIGTWPEFVRKNPQLVKYAADHGVRLFEDGGLDPRNPNHHLHLQAPRQYQA